MTAHTKPHRIDVHHHHASPAFVAEIRARQTGQYALIEWFAGAVDRGDGPRAVQTAMTSVAPPGVWFGDHAAARALAREATNTQRGSRDSLRSDLRSRS